MEREGEIIKKNKKKEVRKPIFFKSTYMHLAWYTKYTG